MDHSIRTVFVACFCAPLIGLLPGCPDPKVPYNVDLVEGIVFGKTYVAGDPELPLEQRTYVLADLLADVLIPLDGPAADRPAFVVLHGGGFTGGTRQRSDLVRYAAHVAAEGYVCFLIDYRLERDAAPAPDPWGSTDLAAAIHAAAVDARAALRYVRANAADWGVDPERIALGGASAGALTSFNAAMYGPDVFDNDGPDFPVPPENNPEESSDVHAVVSLWGAGELAIPAFDANDPPVMMVHGTNDSTAGVSYLEGVATGVALEEADIPVEFYMLLGEGHSAWDATYDGKTLSELTVAFFGRYL